MKPEIILRWPPGGFSGSLALEIAEEGGASEDRPDLHDLIRRMSLEKPLTDQTVVLPSGTIPGHSSDGLSHVAFAIGKAERLAKFNLETEAKFKMLEVFRNLIPQGSGKCQKFEKDRPPPRIAP